MRKNLIAAALLIAMLAGAVINSSYLGRLTDEIAEEAEKAGDAAAEDDWEKARSCAERAVSIWTGKDSYTHLFLRHGEIDNVTDALYGLLSAVMTRDAGSTGAASRLAVYHLNSVSEIEQIRLGSVF